MKRIAKRVAIVFASVSIIVMSLPFFINIDQFRPTIQSELSRVLGRQVTLGNLKLRILAGKVTADDLSVAEDPAFGRPAFLHARSLHVGLEIWPFVFSRQLIVTDLDIDQPEIVLVQASSGDWNFSSLGRKANTEQARPRAAAQVPLNFSVKLIRISNGQLTLRRTAGHWKPVTLEGVNMELREFSSTTTFPFSLAARIVGGGAVQLDGQAGPINPVDSAMTPIKVNLHIGQLDLAKSGLNEMAPTVAGLVSLDGTGESNGIEMRLNGKLKVEKLKLAKNGSPAVRPLELDFAVDHDMRKHSGVVRQADLHIGSALARISGGYGEQGESMLLKMQLSGPQLPVQELEAMLPALGIVLPAGTRLEGGNATANLTSEGPADRLITTGSLALNNTHLAGFDLAKRMSSIEKLAGIKAGPNTDIEALSATIRYAPEGIEAKDMKLLVPAVGELTGAGTVSPANELDFRMTATLHTSGVLAAVGNKPIPFTVGGTCSDPVFRPDVKAIIKDEVTGIGSGVDKAAKGVLKDLLGGTKKR